MPAAATAKASLAAGASKEVGAAKMTDQELMAQIKSQMGPTIRAALAGATIPESFAAALVANESSGDPTVSRFEPSVLASLAYVLGGRKPAFGSITRPILSALLMRAGVTGDPIGGVVNLLLDFSTSWGPTQIMGYQTIGMGVSLEDLKLASLKHFTLCSSILKAFVKEWGLQTVITAGEYTQLFRCWNTGRPDGQTTDLDYVAKGLSRMAIYAALP
jgi:hypothetical protein